MNDINPYLNPAFYFLFYHSIRMYVEINSKISWMLKIDFFPTSLAFLFKDRFSLSQNSKSCFSSIWHKIQHNVYIWNSSIDIEFNNSFLSFSLSLSIELCEAATKIQASFRGHMSRKEQAAAAIAKSAENAVEDVVSKMEEKVSLLFYKIWNLSMNIKKNVKYNVCYT